MTMIYAEQLRGVTKDIVIKNANGVTITPGDNDLVRITIGHVGRTAKFVLTSGTDSDNGSSITKGSTNRVRLDASDLVFTPGTYSFLVDYFDYNDGQEWKTVDRQVIHLEAT